MRLEAEAFGAAPAAAPAAGAPRRFVACLKAYSSAESARRLSECGPLSRSLNTLRGFDSYCADGPRVFQELGCGVYDAALVVTMTGVPPGDLRVCVKAYSDAETRAAAARCEELSRALSRAGGFEDLSCRTGPDSFHRFGCGVYDAALVGRVR